MPFTPLFSLLEQNGINTAGIIPRSVCRVIHPHLLPEGMESVLLFAVPYYVPTPEKNLSLYAVSEDYHLFFRTLFAHLPQGCFGFADHSPIAEVDAAVKAGLGLRGRNGLLITPDYGSYVFIGEIFTPWPAPERALGSGRCSECGKCLAACPSPGDCLSDISQRKGELTAEQQALLLGQNTCWGCDVCQKVCPHNREISPTPIAFFHENRIPVLSGEILAGMDKAAFRRRAYAWRGKSVITRNLNLFMNKKDGQS